MMTGDGNLIELQATVRYRISDPRVYLFEVANAPNLVRSATEAALRDRVSGETFADLLTSDRGRFVEDVLELLRRRCNSYGPHGLGITVEGLALHDLHPPQEVVPAYHAVTIAMEKRDRLINEAHAGALTREREKEGEAVKIKRDAEAAKRQQIVLAESIRDAVLARHAARTRLSAKQEGLLLLGALQMAMDGHTESEVEAEHRRQHAAAVKRQTDLTDFRLYWDSLVQSLKDRDKVIIDAEKVPGRRSLFLMPLDPFRLIPAMPPRRGEP
jgi:regulator of protease activity HflC (stomatin/prohibitin superfamily)